MAANRVYTVRIANANVVNGTQTGTLLQIATPATVGIEILRAWASTKSQSASTLQDIQVLRKTGAATVTSFTPLKNNTNDPASLCIGGAALTGTLATVEGSNGDILYPDQFNLVNGWMWVPTEKERLTVPISAFLALLLPTVPAGTTVWSAGFTYGELT